MADIADEKQWRQRFHRLEDLLQGVDRFKDPSAAAQTREIVRLLMEIHGAGLERILAAVADTGERGIELIDSMAREELVSSLLLLYGLHPLGLESRVLAALEKVRPYLHSHGGNVELLGIGEGIVHLKLQGSCHGCPSSAMTLKQTIEEAIYEKAPDISGIAVEGEIGNAPEEAPAQTSDVPARGGRVGLPILAQ